MFVHMYEVCLKQTYNDCDYLLLVDLGTPLC